MEEAKQSTDSQSRTPHVLMMPSPGMGHLIPLIEFAKRLVFLHRFTVTFLIPSGGPPSKAQVSVLNSLPSAIDHHFLPPAPLDDLPTQAKAETIIFYAVTRSLPSLRDQFKSMVTQRNLVAFVVDQFGTVAFDVAREFNVSPYIYLPCSATTLSLILHFPNLDETVVGEYIDLTEPIRLPGCSPIPGTELPDPFLVRKDDSYKLFLDTMSKFVLAEGIFLNSFPELEPNPINALQSEKSGKPPIYPVGPLVKIDANGSEEEGVECLNWLDEQPHGSVLFVSFGSGGTLSSVQMNELAMGLEMSGQKFIWVVRSPSDKEANASFFSVHSHNDPLKFLPEGFVERNVIIIFFLSLKKGRPPIESISGGGVSYPDHHHPRNAVYGGGSMKFCIERRRFLFFLPLVFFLPHLLSVLELHHDLTSQDQPNKRSKKFDHLILGPAAGQGHPDRLQCSGTKALNITHLPETSHSANTGDNIQFVTVFTIYNASQDSKVIGRSTDVVKVGDASYSKVERSMAVLNVFINFIQVSMPQSNVMILTDPASDLPVRRSRVTVYPIQGEYSRDTLMLQRIRSYISFLDAKLEEQRRGPRHINHYFFTDSDMAVVGDLGEIFHKHPKFHLALTFRNNKAQPLNSGFIAVRGTEDGILRAKDFLQEVLKIYSSKFTKASRMLGDQLALAWVVRSNPSFDARKFSKAETFIEEINGASVLFLPCALYNWTPPEGAGQFHGMPLNVKVVHFKGSRKRLMLESWNFFRSSSSISDMLCLILSSGRTKYDF